MSSNLPESGGSALPAAVRPVSPASPDIAPSPVVAVVFDLGNVLIDWDARAAISAGVGEPRASAFLADESFDFYSWNALQDAGREWADGEAQAVNTHPHYRAEILAYRANFAASMIGPIEPTVAVLRELADAGVPLFGLTNWSHELFPVAREHFDFLHLFEDIVVSGEEGVAKPDPEIFEILAERIEHLGPLDETVFIDDRLDNVQAAARAGMDAIHYTGAEDLRTDLLLRALPVSNPFGQEF
ncbi:MAG: HAD family phosphatase [Actinomycetota bacterium]|nr:HAD family phosphatase [Actinomycetota bacterium]